MDGPVSLARDETGCKSTDRSSDGACESEKTPSGAPDWVYVFNGIVLLNAGAASTLPDALEFRPFELVVTGAGLDSANSSQSRDLVQPYYFRYHTHNV